MSSPIKGLVFDMDGTLLDSHGPLCDAYNETIKAFGHPGLTRKQVLESMGDDERNKFIGYVGLLKAKAAGELLKKNMIEALPKVQPFAGVLEMLDALKSRGIPLAIATSSHAHLTEAHLKRLGLVDRFTTIVTFEDVKKVKPAPDSVKLCLERLKLAPQDAWMIGDSWKDLEAGQGAGTPTIAALWDSLVVRSELERYQPLHWIDSPSKLPALLGL